MVLTDTRLTWYYHGMSIPSTQDPHNTPNPVINTENALFFLIYDGLEKVKSYRYGSSRSSLDIKKIAEQQTKQIMELIRKENSS